MIKAVIFDFWGTLVENGVYSPIKQTYKKLNLRISFSSFVPLFEQVFMTKHYESKVAAFEEVFKAFDIKPDEKVIEELIGLWNKNVLLAKPFPESEKVLQYLKEKGLKLALISNCPTDTTKPVFERSGFEKYFDFVALSWDTGFLKTDKRSFELILEKLGAGKDETLMVGDSMFTDIKGAENVGVKAVLVDRNDRREYPDKVTSLEQLDRFLEED